VLRRRVGAVLAHPTENTTAVLFASAETGGSTRCTVSVIRRLARAFRRVFV
jgi:hypothetical protein